MPSEPLRFREIRNTSAFRLTVLLGGVFAAGLLALLGLIYLTTAHVLVDRNDKILRAQAVYLLQAPAATLPAAIASELVRGNGLAHIEMFSASGERIAGDLAIDQVPRPGHVVEMESPLGPIRALAVRTPYDETILIARDVSQIAYLRGRLLLILVASGIVILCGLTAASLLLAVRPLRRVRDLEQAARDITAGRFETRMPIAGRGDELDQIAGTVNLMMDEIGRVVAQVRSVTDAVAHDLRTPLAHVRQRLLELAKVPGAGPMAARGIAELDLVLARFSALLRIAEIEARARRAAFAPVDLATLAATAIELYEPLAEERRLGLSLDAVGGATIEGDQHLLLEAISNLLDNAIKFAAAAVTLTVTSDEDGPRIMVRDDGPGIPGEERRAVLLRFHRGTHAGGVPGTGLGLAIVAAIAHLHGLEFRLEDAGPGTGLVAVLAGRRR